MSIEFKCDCGKTIRVKDDAAGRKIRCPACDEILRVPEDSEDATALTAAPPKPRRRRDDDEDDDDRPRKSRRRDDYDDEDNDEDDRPRKKRRRRDDDDDDDDDDYARPPRRSRSDRGGSGGQAPASAGATLGAGILMMIGAIVWFVAGLFADIIFFYPPILFVLGIIATFRGAFQLMNGES